MEKGKLKIFFGYSAGVGKTYSMLQEGHRLKRQGVDVLIGYFEPHARPDTLKLAEGFETIPLKEVDYKGIKLKEFDVDKAIERKPQLILVDELAHTNAHGSKNYKRYLDVLELLNNGINVYTTVNVQHLESLNDLIDDETQVSVKERIPDEIFDYADEIVLVDIEPQELLERMHQGKIYKLDKVKTAMTNFFKIENLTTLREISMRRMADRLEKQKNNGHFVSKVLVLISPSPSSAKNIRVAARMASCYHTRFSALYVETNSDLSDEAATILKKHMNLVKDLGGDLVIKYADDVIETIASYVKIAGVTTLIVGKTWQSIGKKVSFENRIIARLPNVEVLIVSDNQSVKKKSSVFEQLLILSRRKSLEKFRMANKTLDIFKALSLELQNKKGREFYQTIAKILERTFERAIQILLQDEVAYYQSHQSIDTTFFDEEHEYAVAKWCLTNGKPAGVGTETLRSAKATYFPILLQDKCIAVIGMSCIKSKITITDRLLFQQIRSMLALLISQENSVKC